jgi:hypothetical protein
MLKDGSEPIQELPGQPNYKCIKCHFITINQNNIITHYKKTHQVSNNIWEKVYLQTFMAGRYSKYWVVKV